MTINHDELRQAAETATPGPWRALERRWENDTDWLVIFSFRTDDEGLEIWDEDSSLPSQANAQFIALANPTTTLALLDEIAALRAALNIEPEEVGRIMHESWMRTKAAQGFHRLPPREDPCRHCHADMVPWQDLPEGQKDINRNAFNDVLEEIRKRADLGDAS